MKLFVIRHATAESMQEAGVSFDDERPLSESGLQEASALGDFLHRKNIHIDLLLHSPLLRAYETAKRIEEKLHCKTVSCSQLSTGCGVRTHLEVISEHKKIDALAIVGHQPTLEELILKLLNAEASYGISMKPCTMAVLDVDFHHHAPKAHLSALLNPDLIL
ncbi:putative phosphohistidine phosphatase, SixA [Chloroherpeton thalassium ATCC 35110]|uniref:Putative phosphohistidine phosphatase, SixA n=1 Tax=Chloroherpeton thalassium (strain ATCC 35110 / GB-78) TaxID=517418 RepID=B3QUD8_CHLT3|nr:histidine phosphatase family protein [Chloroherpeton thalassium]ACF14387.1 putative phosphohistidine phosphatase, SixA [Chloroherpeton thalassium ATCC 35110]